jgi:hypothetical protein
MTIRKSFVSLQEYFARIMRNKTRAAKQREMIDDDEISELSKSRSRFARVLQSSRRRAILGLTTSKSLTLAAEQRVDS